MRETVLLAGYTDFVNMEFIATAFPDCRIVITGNAALKTSFKDHITVYEKQIDDSRCRSIFKMYDVDRVVYFSWAAAPFSGIPADELQRLVTLFSCCTQDTRVIYVMGPKHPDSELISLLEKTALELCAQTSWQTGGVNVIMSPWIYSVQAYQPALTHFFDKGVHEMEIHEEQNLTFLASEDMALLLFRMFDDWEVSIEPFRIPNAFTCSAKAFTSAVLCESESMDIRYTFSDREPYPLSTEPSSALCTRFKWSPVYSFFDDLPEVIRLYRKHTVKRASFFGHFYRFVRFLLPALELVFGLFVAEQLIRLTDTTIQFRMIDFRLLYVVIFGTIYNIRMGVGAAALASLSLIYSYHQEGINWLTIFYMPTNWLPFLAFFTVGALCGYIRSRDREQMQTVREESEALNERCQYLMSVNRDILDEKQKYRNQIIGSRDSFGKIFEITRQLDADHPKYLMANAVGIVERIMGNRSVAIYSCTGSSPYGRLTVSSWDVELPGSLNMQPYYEKLLSVGKGNVWINRELDKAFPRYMYAVWKENVIDAVIILNQAEFSQMTLYYENLFKVVCGLISASLLRANAYQNVIHEIRCEPGTTNLLKESCFEEELRYAADMQEHHLASYVLLRIASDGGTLAEKEAQISRCIRKADMIGFYHGTLYVLLLQADEKHLPVIGQRFDKYGVTYDLVSPQEQNNMLL